MGNSLAPVVYDSQAESGISVASEQEILTNPVTPKMCNLCSSSFKKLTHVRSKRGKSNEVSTVGVQNFYNAFYFRLEGSDNINLNFQSILRPSTSKKSQASLRGAILMRMIRFVLNVQSDNQETKNTLNALGVSHAKRAIHSAENTVFTNTLLRTILSELGSNCTPDVAEAWSILLGFVTFHMNVGDKNFINSVLGVGRKIEHANLASEHIVSTNN